MSKPKAVKTHFTERFSKNFNFNTSKPVEQSIMHGWYSKKLEESLTLYKLKRIGEINGDKMAVANIYIDDKGNEVRCSAVGKSKQCTLDLKYYPDAQYVGIVKKWKKTIYA